MAPGAPGIKQNELGKILENPIFGPERANRTAAEPRQARTVPTDRAGRPPGLKIHERLNFPFIFFPWGPWGNFNYPLGPPGPH